MTGRLIFCVSLILMLMVAQGCNLKQRLPLVAEKASCYRFPTGDGPEDMVMDTFNGAPRILISSYERRKPADHGDIYAFDTITGNMRVLVRTNEPETLAAFKPHGIDIRHDRGVTELYVILHDPRNHGKRLENGVGIYRVYRNELRMTGFLEDPACLWSPNDLSVTSGGGIYLTNDYRSDLDLYFRRKSSEIAYYNPKTGKWKIVADGLAFANGIYATPSTVYVSTTLGNRILSYPVKQDGNLGEPGTVTELKGGDNIMPYGKYLLVCAHFDDLAFMKHAKNAKKPSPSVVFRIDPASGDKKAIFADGGRALSAASTALVFGKKFYISQVFDPFILVCDLPADIDW